MFWFVLALLLVWFGWLGFVLFLLCVVLGKNQTCFKTCAVSFACLLKRYEHVGVISLSFQLFCFFIYSFFFFESFACCCCVVMFFMSECFCCGVHLFQQVCLVQLCLCSDRSFEQFVFFFQWIPVVPFKKCKKCVFPAVFLFF